MAGGTPFHSHLDPLHLHVLIKRSSKIIILILILIRYRRGGAERAGQTGRGREGENIRERTTADFSFTTEIIRLLIYYMSVSAPLHASVCARLSFCGFV